MKTRTVPFRVCALLALTGVALAAEPSRPPAEALGLIRDLRLTILARRALQADVALKDHNLGVEVRRGVAHVWGPISSPDLAHRVVSRLGAIDGVLSVRTELHSGRPATDSGHRALKVGTLPPGPIVVPPAIPPPTVATPVKQPRTPALADHVAKVRQKYPRLRTVRVDVSGRTVTVYRGEDDEAAGLFARLLGEVEGIDEVRLAR